MKELNLQGILNWIKADLEKNNINSFRYNSSCMTITNDGRGHTQYFYYKGAHKKMIDGGIHPGGRIGVSQTDTERFIDKDFKSKIVRTDKQIPHKMEVIFNENERLNISIIGREELQSKETSVIVPKLLIFNSVETITHYLATVKYEMHITYGKFSKTLSATPDDMLLYSTIHDLYNTKINDSKLESNKEDEQKLLNLLS